MNGDYIPATPYAKRLARENNIDLSAATPTGMFGAVRAADVLAIATAPPENTRATPLAVRVADDLGVDISTIKGSGHAGKVTRADVLAGAGKAAHAAAYAPAVGRRVPMSSMRRTVARRMLQSHTEIPPVTHVVRNDVTSLLEARASLKAGGRKYSINDFVLKAVARALDSNRHMLVGIDGDCIVFRDSINIGMAVALDEGLIVPVLRDAEAMTLDEISAAAKDLAARARANKLKPEEYSCSTFTVSNLGMYDVESFTPIVNQPDAAILGICAIVDELAMQGGSVVVRKIMRTCLTYDHRLLDGASAAVFQREVKRLLENPMEIVL